MRVGIDCHALDGIYQGLRTHLLALCGSLAEVAPDIELVLFTADPVELGARYPALVRPNVSLVRLPPSDPATRLGWFLPRLARRHGVGLLHCQYISPLWDVCPTVVTIHDILFESHPEWFTPWFRLRSRMFIRRSAGRATRVVTGSRFSRREIVDRWRLPQEKVTVIADGVDVTRFHPGEEGADLVFDRGLVPGGYLLTVGRLEPRKNHVTLLRAFAALETDLPLVIVGQRDFRYREVFQTAADLGLEGRVRFIADAGDDELPALYRHARLMAYLSWAEGFGLPPLEALASGVPVVVSNSTSLPEVVGDAALGVDPGDAAAAAEAMRRILRDDELSVRLTRAGPRQAALFSWGEAARGMAGVYREVLAERRG